MGPLTHCWQDELFSSAAPVRKATNKILEMIDDGLLNPKDVALMTLKWMSEDEVQAMAKANELFEEEAE